MAKEFALTDEMRAQIGRESPPWTAEVTTTSVRAFARGVGYTDRIYFDVEAAKAAGYRNLPAPPTYLGTPVFIPGESDNTFSAPRSARVGISHGLKGLLDGGTDTEYFADICAGDTLTAVTRLRDLQTRPSKALGTMLLTTVETTFTDAASGKVVAVQRGQAIYY